MRRQWLLYPCSPLLHSLKSLYGLKPLALTSPPNGCKSAQYSHSSNRSNYFSRATQYDATTKEFTHLASWECTIELGTFIFQLRQRKELNEKIWHKDYQEYKKWMLLRKLTQSTPLAAWIAGWAPQLSNDYRYSFQNDLDQPINDSPSNLAWFERPRSSLLGQHSIDEHTLSQNQGNSSLSNANFVNIFASALEAVKGQAIETHNITITSAVIAKPSWIFNELNDLLDQACLKANINVLDKLDRAEAARLVASKKGKTKALVIEQWNYGCVMYRPSSSMGCDHLDASWVPRTLLYNLLRSLGEQPNGTEDSLRASEGQLLREILRTRLHLSYAYKDDRALFDKEETTIVVPNFGSPNFNFRQSLSGANISLVEEEYIEHMQLSIETMLLKGEIHQFLNENNLSENLDQNGTINFAKTISHPEVASGGSWWEAIDALIVVADFPELRLIQSAADRAIGSITEQECDISSPQDYMRYDIVARGAALHAVTFVENWDEHQVTEKCEEMVEDDGYYQCLDAEKYERCKEAEELFHECWYEENYRQDVVHEEL